MQSKYSLLVLQYFGALVGQNMRITLESTDSIKVYVGFGLANWKWHLNGVRILWAPGNMMICQTCIEECMTQLPHGHSHYKQVVSVQ